MNKALTTPLIVGLLFSVLLSFLFVKSQVNQQQHLLITTTLSTLNEYDQILNQSIIQNQTRLHKNFDFISISQLKIFEIIDKLALQFDGLEVDNKTLKKKLDHVIELENRKNRQVERYKQSAAVNNFSRQNLPGAMKKILISLSQDVNFNEKNKRLLRKELMVIDNIVNRYIAGFGFEAVKLQSAIFSLKEKIEPLHSTSKEERALFIWYLNTVDAVMFSTSALSERVEYIQKIGTVKSISYLQKEYVKNFKQRNYNAFLYKKALFVAAVLLLVYLAVVLVRLKAAGEKLDRSLQHLEFRKDALDKHAIVSITDVKGNIIYANNKFCEISQYTLDELIGKKHNIIKSDVHDKAFFIDMWKIIANGDSWQGEICNRAKDGSLYWVATTLIPRISSNGKPYEYIGMRTDITAQKIAENEVVALARFPMENPEPVLRINEKGEVIFQNTASSVLIKHWNTKINKKLPDEWVKKVTEILASNQSVEIELNVEQHCFLLNFTPVVEERYVNIYGRDITAKKQAEDSLSYQATHDDLTGLVNRYAFDIELEKALSLSHSKNKHHVLLYLDLDQFKVVNDTCGHVAGDELLRQLSQMMLSMFRDDDTLARLGGDEFGVLLNSCDMVAGKKVANELLDMINHFRFIWQDKQFEVGASIGMVEINNKCDSVVTIMGHADVAVYAAKDAGRHQIKVFNQDDSESVQRQSELQWASIIPKALAEDRFCLMVQSILPLDPAKNMLPHYEILIRMIDENGDYIPPGAFIPAAERYGLMKSIDQWVVAHAFAFLKEYLQIHGAENLPVLAINLSGESIGSEGLLAYIRTEINENNVPAKNLCFEVTETAAIGNLNEALGFINSLKEIGCSFALDDFGSGLSSFAYLKNLPVDYLKIDGAFVKDMVDDPIDASMVAAINQVGHIMNIHTIAEFVEDQQIMDALTELGVDYAQGYHIDKPAPLYERFPLHPKKDSQLAG